MNPKQLDTLDPGQLYFLSHPESDQFSGYGLTTIAGRRDLLTGLLMLDRLHVADPSWLDRVGAQYGDYQLVTISATGERGILAQMRVQPGSNRYLERLDHPIAQELKRVLAPFLEVPPSPVLKLQWDESQSIWRSDFWIGLPPDLQETIEVEGLNCIPIERADREVTFATHLSDGDTKVFRDSRVYFAWQFLPSHTAPLIRFYAAVMHDDLHNPHYLECLFDIGDASQARNLALLANQPWLSLDVYNQEYEYAYSKKIAHPISLRERLDRALHMAEAWQADAMARGSSFDHTASLFG